MKKSILSLFLLFSLCICMSSCFTYTYTVGDGAQIGLEIKKKNHYFIFGLAPVSIADPAEMARSAENYDVKITHTFIDGLIRGLTSGLYTPTTTIVTK